MRYILLDFEWNNAYSVRLKRFVNEIIQIGAVMLDDQLRTMDAFEVLVRSTLTKKLRSGFTRLTGITNEQMRAGVPFAEAIRRYRRWARVGPDTVTMTWSNSDLYAVFENIRNFLPEGGDFPFGNYVDLQGFVQDVLTCRGVALTGQISLAKAAELFSISTEHLRLHTAQDDSTVCAALLREVFDSDELERRILNTESPDFFDRLTFKPHYLKSVTNVGKKSGELRFRCENCGSYAKRTGKWRSHNRWLQANFRCPNCDNRFSGRLMLKQTYDDLIIRKRIVPIGSTEGLDGKETDRDAVQPVPETV